MMDVTQWMNPPTRSLFIGVSSILPAREPLPPGVHPSCLCWEAANSRPALTPCTPTVPPDMASVSADILVSGSVLEAPKLRCLPKGTVFQRNKRQMGDRRVLLFFL